MYAVVTHGPQSIGQTETVQLPLPTPGKTEVLVEMKAVSINYRDLLAIDGASGWAPSAQRILCSDGAGVVVEVGSDVDCISKGDRVATCFNPKWDDGPFSEAKSFPGPGGKQRDGVLAQFRSLCARDIIRIPDIV